MSAHVSVIAELEVAIRSGRNDERAGVRVVDVLLANAERLTEPQIGAFDDVLGRLVGGINGKARVELSRRLAPVENAPTGTVRRLALDEDIAVAGPGLVQSARRTTGDLVAIAKINSQAPRLALAGRAAPRGLVAHRVLRHA